MWTNKITLDRHGFYQNMKVWPSNKPHHLGALACTPLCDLNLKRPHFTCIICRWRRVYYKKMKEKIPVYMYIIYVHRNRRFARLKDFLLDKWKCIGEVLAN